MRILLADGNAEVLSALRLVLEQPGENQPRYVIVGEAPDTIRLFAQVTSCCPDVVLLDTDLPGLLVPRRATGKSSASRTGSEITSPLAELVETVRLLCPSVYLIALSSRPNAEKESLRAKMDAFACKSDPPESLVNLLNHIFETRG